MAIREILIYPDPRLKQVSQPVTAFDQQLADLITDMTDTMYAASGIGLAAIQVNVPKRVVVMDLSEKRDQLRVFVNPEITDLGHGSVEAEEGCLSVPAIYASVTRAEKVLVSAFDATGKRFELEAEGLLAVCIQHEVDHLHGRVFVDYLSRLKRGRIRQKLKKGRQPAPMTA